MKKASLTNLKVTSFITEKEAANLKGGIQTAGGNLCQTGANCPISGIVNCLPTYRYPCP